VRKPLVAVSIAVVALAALALSSDKGSTAHRISLVQGGTFVTYTFQGSKVRIEEEGRPRVLIFDGTSMEYFEVDDSKKTWAVATLSDAVSQGKELGKQLMTGEVALSPETQAVISDRARFRTWIQLLKQSYFEPTKNHAVVAGQACAGYTEHADGRVVAEGCYIPWSEKTIRKEDVAGVTRLAELLNEELAFVPSAAGIDLRDGPLGRLARAPGFPARRYDVAPDGKSGVQSRLVEFVGRSPVTPETFRPPADYTKLDRPAAFAPLLERMRQEAPVQP
jgi:hypothetical protein